MAGLISIAGGGESGTGAAVLAKQKGYTVFLSDSGEIKDKYKEVLSNHGIEFEEGGHDLDRLIQADELIKSPGIPDKAPLVKMFREAGKPVIDEIEFAGRYTAGKTICITGSNGKTTTPMLCYHMLKNGGLDVALAGNIGRSMAAQLAERDYAYWVLELSSFQLDGMYRFKADIAILLNITPDHLDRYNYQLENYVASKFRITQNQDEQCAFIYWCDDPIIKKELSKTELKARQFPFTTSLPENPETWLGAWQNENEIHIQTINNYLTMSIHDLALQGKHNVFNSMASGIAGRILELRKELVRDSLMNFDNIEHRLEFIAKVAGITFINDSKATNINSTWYALESVEEPIIWIAGGVDKGNDYSELFPLIENRVKALICLGVDNEKLHKAFEGKISVIKDVMSADEAVKTAYDLGYKGDTVLLSPACASFDLFENYEDRGHQFKAAVKRL